MSAHCLGCNVEFPPDGGSGVYGFCLQCREAEPGRAKGDWRDEAKAHLRRIQSTEVDPLITRTPRKRSRWGRPWERKR